MMQKSQAADLAGKLTLLRAKYGDLNTAHVALYVAAFDIRRPSSIAQDIGLSRPAVVRALQAMKESCREMRSGDLPPVELEPVQKDMRRLTARQTSPFVSVIDGDNRAKHHP